jgi:hypothetical protein
MLYYDTKDSQSAAPLDKKKGEMRCLLEAEGIVFSADGRVDLTR